MFIMPKIFRIHCTTGSKMYCVIGRSTSSQPKWWIEGLVSSIFIGLRVFASISLSTLPFTEQAPDVSIHSRINCRRHNINNRKISKLAEALNQGPHELTSLANHWTINQPHHNNVQQLRFQKTYRTSEL